MTARIRSPAVQVPARAINHGPRLGAGRGALHGAALAAARMAASERGCATTTRFAPGGQRSRYLTTVSGGHWYHRQRQAPAARTRDPAFQDQLMDRLAGLRCITPVLC